MLSTFTLSMFISNTATATMMLAIMTPLIRSLATTDPYRTALLISIAFASSLGGMGSIIGSPPNAIAVGALQSIDNVDFLRWLTMGLPPALTMLFALWGYLSWRYPADIQQISFDALPLEQQELTVPRWQHLVVMLVFGSTILLWITQSWHGLPATVVSFLPICLLTLFGILNSDDICALRWDILLLIAGGLSLGVGLTETQLDRWLLSQLPIDGLSPLAIAAALIVTTIVASNLMSNTAAANLLIPIAIAASPNHEVAVVTGIALGASSAMCLPISTPPNAIVYGVGDLKTRDLIECGLFIGLIAPVLILAWLFMAK